MCEWASVSKVAGVCIYALYSSVCVAAPHDAHRSTAAEAAVEAWQVHVCVCGAVVAVEGLRDGVAALLNVEHTRIYSVVCRAVAVGNAMSAAGADAVHTGQSWLTASSTDRQVGSTRCRM